MKFKILKLSVTQISMLFILFLGTYSCIESTNNGPCDYTEEKFNMIIVDVQEDSVDADMFIVWVDFDGNIALAEGSHTLSEVRDVETTYDFVIDNNIKPGNIYTGTVHTIVPGSGDCIEEIIDWGQKLIK